MMKAEQRRIIEAKEGPCIACLVRVRRGEQESPVVGCDYHHTKSGNIRRGHRYGFALCPWHHRAVPMFFGPHTTREMLGPSLMDGSRLFHETYGHDDDLIALQDEILGVDLTRP